MYFFSTGKMSLVMEYAAFGSLRDVLEQHSGALSLRCKALIARDAASAA